LFFILLLSYSLIGPAYPSVGNTAPEFFCQEIFKPAGMAKIGLKKGNIMIKCGNNMAM